jgi:hypothetical protein
MFQKQPGLITCKTGELGDAGARLGDVGDVDDDTRFDIDPKGYRGYIN